MASLGPPQKASCARFSYGGGPSFPLREVSFLLPHPFLPLFGPKPPEGPVERGGPLKSDFFQKPIKKDPKNPTKFGILWKNCFLLS